jgi:hypothetical protein
MHARKFLGLIVATALILLAALTCAASGFGTGAGPDSGYTLQKAVVGAGGSHSAGESGAGVVFSLDATGGQPAAGRAAGEGAEPVLHVGFWSACEAVAPAPPEVSVLLAGSDIELDWLSVPEDAAYKVWVSEEPYLAPDDATDITPVLTDLTVFTDPGAAASLTNHFYVLRGLNVCGAASGNSGRTGEFTFGLTPGS